MADVSTPEAAIRNYLTYLTDPGSLIDSSAVARLEADAAKATDPIDRLRAITAVQGAKTTAPDVYEKAFIAEAKEWADAEGIPVSAFEEMGVPRKVLESAGLLGKLTRRAGRGIRRAAPVVGPVAGRRRGIKSDALEAGILALDSPFSVKDVSERVGGARSP